MSCCYERSKFSANNREWIAPSSTFSGDNGVPGMENGDAFEWVEVYQFSISPMMGQDVAVAFSAVSGLLAPSLATTSA